MGTFDSIIVSCPACGADIEAQSKGADVPTMRVFRLGDPIPQDVLSNIRRHAPWICEVCGAKVDIRITIVVSPPFVVSHDAVSSSE